MLGETMFVVAWTLAIVTVVGVAAVVAVLVRQGSPYRLSEEGHEPSPRSEPLVDRPAGPDAEPMAVGQPGQPTVASPPERPRVEPPNGVASLEPTAESSADAERPVDPDIEAIEAEERPTEVPPEERAVPEDVNEYVPDEPVPEDINEDIPDEGELR